jgi:hypothetical protein
MLRTRRTATVRCLSLTLQRHLLAATLATLATIPGTLVAQEAASPPAEEASCRRCLAGHRFLVSSVAPDPFVTTHFRSGLGGGFASGLEVPFRNLDGAVIDTIGGGVGFVALDFEYQYAATSWLGLRGGTNIVARVGTSARSLVASGAEALSGLSLGATGRVWGGRTAQVSLTADVRRNQVYVLDPYSFVQSVVDNGYTEAAQEVLLTTASTNRYTGGVRAAWAPAPWLGLNGTFEAGSADDPRPDEGNQSVTEIGASSEVDFGVLTSVPVGLTLGARSQTGSGRAGGLAGKATTYALGLFYTGRPHFLIGGESTWARVDFDQAEVTNVDAVQFRLVTRYDF